MIDNDLRRAIAHVKMSAQQLHATIVAMRYICDECETLSPTFENLLQRSVWTLAYVGTAMEELFSSDLPPRIYEVIDRATLLMLGSSIKTLAFGDKDLLRMTESHEVRQATDFLLKPIASTSNESNIDDAQWASLCAAGGSKDVDVCIQSHNLHTTDELRAHLTATVTQVLRVPEDHNVIDALKKASLPLAAKLMLVDVPATMLSACQENKIVDADQLRSYCAVMIPLLDAIAHIGEAAVELGNVVIERTALPVQRNLCRLLCNEKTLEVRTCRKYTL